MRSDLDEAREFAAAVKGAVEASGAVWSTPRPVERYLPAIRKAALIASGSLDDLGEAEALTELVELLSPVMRLADDDPLEALGQMAEEAMSEVLLNSQEEWDEADLLYCIVSAYIRGDAWRTDAMMDTMFSALTRIAELAITED